MSLKSQLNFFNKLCIVPPQGSNPIWDPDSDPVAPRKGYLTDLDLKNGKLNSYRNGGDDDDVGSLSSGDSVLIGVENQAEFRGYKERVKTILIQK
jgi:hypothetical protein